MDWFQTPYLLVAFVGYALVMLVLLALYFRNGSEPAPGSSMARERAVPGNYASSGPSSRISEVSVVEDGFASERNDETRDPRVDFVPEAERLFSGEKDPVFVTDEHFNVFYRNRQAAKLFGEGERTFEDPLFEVLGTDEKSIRKHLGGSDGNTSASIGCTLPNGKSGTVQVRLAILNRVPRILAIRVAGLEEEKPSWLSRSGKNSESTSLTRGSHLDFREVDPVSVELSADQMLGPLREMDASMTKVNLSLQDEDSEGAKSALQPARNKLRRLIRHIEEIDWMLQVSDGHLQLRPESFRAYEVLSAMAEAANRVSSDGAPRLVLNPDQPPAVEPILSGDRRVFEKILTQLLTSAFRAADEGEIRATLRTEPLENPTQSDDWYLFAGESDARSESTLLTIRIDFQRPETPSNGSDLPAVVETLGSQIMDPRTTKKLDFVKKGRDSDLFGLTLARELVGKLDGDLLFQTDATGRSEFVLRLTMENASV